jgi:hypothetical protein
MLPKTFCELHIYARTYSSIKLSVERRSWSLKTEQRVGLRFGMVSVRRPSTWFQKGGDPAAGSPTATLLRLHPSHQALLGGLPPLQVGTATSGATDSHGVTGGVYKARERIHRGMLIRDY